MTVARPKSKTKIFVVGDDKRSADFTPEEVELMIYKIAAWFGDPACDRKYEDPIKAAREFVKRALNGVLADGRVWKAASPDFNKRIMVLCNFNLETEEGRRKKASVLFAGISR
jgi:hypothetical protein